MIRILPAIGLLALLCSISHADERYKTVIIEPSEQPVYIVLGGTLYLKCVQKNGVGMTWYHNDTLVTNDPKTKLTSTVINNQWEGRLERKNMSYTDSGVYRCHPNGYHENLGYNVPVYVRGRNDITPSAVDPSVEPESAVAIKVEGTGYVLYGLNRTAHLQCKYTGDDETKPIEWWRGGKQLNEEMPTAENPDRMKYTMDRTNNTITIIYVGEDDLGDYQCVFKMNSETNFTSTVTLEAQPRVIRFAKSKNLVQGDPLQLDCKAYGLPKPTIVWLKDGEVINGTDSRVTFKDYEGLENATLRIENLDYPDRAVYTCEATNIHGDGTSEILVRVKDKLAALWPFLGICVEVAILCVIIFIYEKRRAKQMEEEERREEADHLTNSNDHKANDDVRQRK